MQQSRDDFVIAIRSAFLKKGTQQRFSLLGLIFFSIILLILGSFNYKVIDYVKIIIQDTVYRSSFIISGPENLIKKNYLYLKSHFTFYNKNKKNEEDLKNFRSKDLTNRIIKLENDKYKRLIDDYFIKNNEIYAKVLIDKQSPFLKSVVLNKGSKHNIKLGMIVIDEPYLVGKVIEVNYLTSRVLLLPDINSKIPVSVQPGDIQAIMSGNGDRNGFLQYIKNRTIKKSAEDIIILTSGAGGVFKSGIPIGKVSKNSSSNNDIIINFDIDFTQLQYVKVISFKKEKNVLDQLSKEEMKQANYEIELLKKEKETVRILLEQKKISDEIRVKIEEENDYLKIRAIKLENNLSQLKEELKKIDLRNEESRFNELNILYGRKCKKTFYNELYKVGTAEYKNCILKKGKIN
jgi:rod shape-determining protein MreC